MKLVKTIWIKVKKYLKIKQNLMIPTGSTKQQDPQTLMSTDFIAIFNIARKAGKGTSTLITPLLDYTIVNYLTKINGKKVNELDYV